MSDSERYLFVSVKERDVAETVGGLFREFNGLVPLSVWDERMQKKFGYNPARVINEIQLGDAKECREHGINQVYQIVDDAIAERLYSTINLNGR